jgi:hypothetical protein
MDYVECKVCIHYVTESDICLQKYQPIRKKARCYRFKNIIEAKYFFNKHMDISL